MFQVGDASPELTLSPVFGLPVKLHQGVSIVCFMRPLSGSTARSTIQVLTEAWPRFDAEGFKLVGVTRTDLTFARDFVPRHHVLFPIVVDERGELFAQFGVGKDTGFLKTAMSLRPRHYQALSEAFALGRQANALPGSDLPAFFVVRDGRFVYASYGASALEQPQVEELWRAATG